jgi:hypothetical protein
LEDEGPQQPPL